MAYIQRITPPPNKVYNFSVKDFTGGLNNRSDQMKSNQASSLMNMSFADDTLMETRFGQKYYDDLTVATVETILLDTPIIGQTDGDTIKKHTPKTEEVAINGTNRSTLKITAHGLSVNDVIVNTSRQNRVAKVTKVNDVNTIIIEPAIPGQTAGDIIQTYTYVDSGTIDVGVPDMFTMTDHGLANGDVIENTTHQGLSLVSVSNGNEVSFIDEYKPYKDLDVLLRASNGKLYVESEELSLITGRACGVNHMGYYILVDGNKMYAYGKWPQADSTYEKVTGTPIDDYCFMEVISPDLDAPRLDTSHYQGVLNVDYNNFKVWYVPCENEFLDEFSGANVVPARVKYVVSHKGRVFASGDEKDDDNVFISSINRPFYFPVSLPIQMPPNSDKVRGMVVYDDSVVVGRGEDIHVITGETNRTDVGAEIFTLKKLNTHTGIANNDCMKVAHNYLFFMGSDGNAYSLSSVRHDEKTLSTTILTKTIDIKKDPINVTLADLETACSCFHDDIWYVSIKDKVLLYSYRKQAWSVYNNINAKVFYVKDGALIWGRADGRVATFDESNFLDFGVPYRSWWYGKAFDMEEANVYKFFKECFLVAQVFENYPSIIDVLFEVDYADVADDVSINNAMSIWNVSKWGDRFITRNIVESLPIHIGQRGRNLKVKLSCNHDVDKVVVEPTDLNTIETKYEGLFAYVSSEDKYYLYTNHAWKPYPNINQRMKVRQVNGDYEMRGKR